MSEESRWKPRRKGEFYCSPGCGAGCTWKEYCMARSAAQALAKEMGEEWEPEVWENMGWHYCAVRPHMSVHPNLVYDTEVAVSYTAFFSKSEDARCGGEWNVNSKTARRAALLVVEQVERVRQTLDRALDTVFIAGERIR